MLSLLPFSEIQDDRIFEQMCFDLVSKTGLSNVRWRGPGPDGGRDIEADWFTGDPSGYFTRQQWYIECKFYKESVPFSEIEPKLLAAATENRDALLLITSSVLKNTCLDAIEAWIAKRGGRPGFRYWNGHELAKRLIECPEIVARYFSSFSTAIPLLDLKRESRRREELLSGVQDRMSQIVGARCQSVVARLAVLAEAEPIAKRTLLEAEFLSSQLLSTRALLRGLSVPPSLRLVEIGEVVKGVADTLAEAYPKLSIKCTIADAMCLSSRPMLQSMVLEILSNACAYASTEITVGLSRGDNRWSLLVENDHNMPLQNVAIPTLGFRHPDAHRYCPSGSGYGCWIVSEFGRLLGLGVDWRHSTNRWTTEITGLTPVAEDKL